MTAATTDPVTDPATTPDRDNISSDEKANSMLHKENKAVDIEAPAPFIPTDDTEYNVTFKTWIVVWV
jgi:hypothetical protein